MNIAYRSLGTFIHSIHRCICVHKVVLMDLTQPAIWATVDAVVVVHKIKKLFSNSGRVRRRHSLVHSYNSEFTAKQIRQSHTSACISVRLPHTFWNYICLRICDGRLRQNYIYTIQIFCFLTTTITSWCFYATAPTDYLRNVSVHDFDPSYQFCSCIQTDVFSFSPASILNEGFPSSLSI